MVPPKFGDLNKTAKDLFSDDFGFGVAKLIVKTKTANGVNLKLEQARKFEDGAVAGLLEVKYTNNAQGLTVKDTWDTKNVVASEISVANKPLAGHKFTLNNNFSTTGACSGLKFKHEYANEKIYAEAVLTASDVTLSSVFGGKGFNVGASAAYDTKKSALTKHSIAGNWKDSGLTVFASLNNGTEVAGSIHHKPRDNLQTGIEFKWNTKGGESGFGFVSKFDFDKDSFVKTSVDKKLLVGLSYTQKLRPEVSLTLSAQVDTANLSADKHRLGAALTFDF